ncbi:ArsR family transcriptional regulator [Streptomyces sp. NBC_01314]|uniref:ArsR family transcriptional regulator n=1 Tax=Streptomyces sp. NBC_01314 TaxID=2903821 RepID=UPI00308C6BFB|nr:ArsR family transcriptional regulator [Streptomyces sp. NBC_01314]
MFVPLYQAESFRMRGHPVRIRVLELLHDGPMPVRDLLAAVGVEPSNLSQQLAGGHVADSMKAARRILTEMPAGRNEQLSELREAGVAAR